MTYRVGVIGGGQLARMMIAPAVELGVEIRVLAEQEGMAAALAATAVGDYRDADTVLAFAREVDVITFDHEHVPQQVLRALVDAGVAVHPGPDALRYAQDKLLMRTRLQEMGMPQPDWAAATGPDELGAFLEAHGGRAVVKTPRGGYDGKGVRVVSSPDGAADWFTALAEDAGGGALLVEELVEFTRELAQQVARTPSGAVRAYPVVETMQRDGVCAEGIPGTYECACPIGFDGHSCEVSVCFFLSLLCFAVPLLLFCTWAHLGVGFSHYCHRRRET